MKPLRQVIDIAFGHRLEKKQISLRLPVDLGTALRAVCDQYGMPLSVLIVELLRVAMEDAE